MPLTNQTCSKVGNKSDRKAVKATKILVSSFWWIALIALAVIMFSVIGAKMRGEVPQVFGYSILNVVSGSMEDEIPTNSYILVKQCTPEEVKKNDIICFYSDDPSILGFPNTHRVHENPILTENGYEFVTKGDANPEKDSYTAKGSKLIGKYVKALPNLTAFVTMLENGGMPVITTALFLLTVSMLGYSLFKAAVKKAEENAADKKNSAIYDEKSPRDSTEDDSQIS